MGTLSLILIFLSNQFAQFFLHNSALAYLFQIGFIFLFFEGILTHTFALFKIERQPTRFGLLSLFRFTAGVGFNILLVVLLRKGVAGIIIGNLFAATIVGIYALYLIRTYLIFRFDWELLREQFHYSLPLLPAIMAFFLIDFVDRFMLERMRDFSQVGIYSLAYQFGTVINLVILGYRSAYAPFFFHLDRKEYPELGRAFRYFIIGVGVIYWMLVLFLPEVFQIFVGRNFHQAMGLVGIIALGFVAYGVYINFASHLYLRDRTSTISLLTTVALAINIVTNLILIPEFGAYGAAWATLISYMVLAFLAYRITLPRGYDFGLMIKVLLFLPMAVLISRYQFPLLPRIGFAIGYLGFILILCRGS